MIVESPALAALDGIRHGFGTREGGVSGGIYSSLNCGIGSKDDQSCVAENRARFAASVGARPQALVTPYQIHSAHVVVADQPWTRATAPKADAVVTATPGLAIAVSTADCVPVLFADPVARIAGAAHAGWRGAMSGILDATLEAMERLGAARARIAVAIGPAISQPAYEVGEEFEEKFLEHDPENARFFARKSASARPHFDLTGYAAERLKAAGAAGVENLQLCTYQDNTRFFSYRRSCHRNEPDYGRQISAIMIT
jgi:hypothetical protein